MAKSKLGVGWRLGGALQRGIADVDDQFYSIKGQFAGVSARPRVIVLQSRQRWLAAVFGNRGEGSRSSQLPSQRRPQSLQSNGPQQQPTRPKTPTRPPPAKTQPPSPPQATVFITGASGYIGSVVLEQLLRTTDVAAVYLLLRARRGADPADRVATLMQSSLFHLVRDKRHLVDKVKAVQGDIQLPGLGLSAADRAALCKSVHVIVHCAADIRLEPTIQESLQVGGGLSGVYVSACLPLCRALLVLCWPWWGGRFDG